MIEVQGNIWELAEFSSVAITTNCMIKKNGEAVMGRGVALQAYIMFPGIARSLANNIEKFGNIPSRIGSYFYDRDDKARILYHVYSFPTKIDWRDNSVLSLIVNNAKILQAMYANPEDFYLPRPGCGNGGLDWEKCVKPELSKILDDRFVIVNKI